MAPLAKIFRFFLKIRAREPPSSPPHTFFWINVILRIKILSGVGIPIPELFADRNAIPCGKDVGTGEGRRGGGMRNLLLVTFVVSTLALFFHFTVHEIVWVCEIYKRGFGKTDAQEIIIQIKWEGRGQRRRDRSKRRDHLTPQGKEIIRPPPLTPPLSLQRHFLNYI